MSYISVRTNEGDLSVRNIQLLLVSSLMASGPWGMDDHQGGLSFISLAEVNSPNTKRALLCSVSPMAVFMVIEQRDFPFRCPPTHRMFDWERPYFGLPELPQ